jgi:hypothetical protein
MAARGVLAKQYQQVFFLEKQPPCRQGLWGRSKLLVVNSCLVFLSLNSLLFSKIDLDFFGGNSRLDLN